VANPTETCFYAKEHFRPGPAVFSLYRLCNPISPKNTEGALQSRRRIVAAPGDDLILSERGNKMLPGGTKLNPRSARGTCSQGSPRDKKKPKWDQRGHGQGRDCPYLKRKNRQKFFAAFVKTKQQDRQRRKSIFTGLRPPFIGPMGIFHFSPTFIPTNWAGKASPPKSFDSSGWHPAFSFSRPENKKGAHADSWE